MDIEVASFKSPQIKRRSLNEFAGQSTTSCLLCLSFALNQTESKDYQSFKAIQSSENDNAKVHEKSELTKLLMRKHNFSNYSSLQYVSESFYTSNPLMNTNKKQILNSIKALGSSVLPDGSRLLLFGSQARGDERGDSDWDLLILIDNKYLSSETFGSYAYPFVELGWEYGAYFSPKIYSFDEWEKRKGTPFYDNIKREGIVLC